MLNIENNSIRLTRGDTLRAEVSIMQQDGCELTPYTPQDGDAIRFAVKRDEFVGVRYRELKDQQPLILKEIPTDTMLLHLSPADTASLAFGSYLYDIEIEMSDGTVDTFIADATFELTTEVH